MAPGTMNAPISLRLPQAMMVELEAHLFAGDRDEHGAVIGASVLETSRGTRLIGHRLFLAVDGSDYVAGQRGYRMLTADFVRRCALACANDGLAYLAVHNHPGVDHVAFSDDDLASHRRGYPALLDILNGPPVGALVFASQAVAGEIWLSKDVQRKLKFATVVGRVQRFLHPFPNRAFHADSQYDRQVRLFGDRGQAILAAQKVGIVGAGGAGSLINEYLARLGVGQITVVDFDRLDPTNYPRLVGAQPSDLGRRFFRQLPKRPFRRHAELKAKIAERVARAANPRIQFDAIPENVTARVAAESLLDCDAIFLAADSMHARLLVNALCHQYLIPVWQTGAKVQVDRSNGDIEDIFSVVRQLIPGETCLWCNQLISPSRLADEAASPEQSAAQRYIDEVAAPSVITLNAVAAAHAVNDYLFATVSLSNSDHGDQRIYWTKHRPLNPQPAIEIPRQDPECTECKGRLGTGRLSRLPVRDERA